MSSEVSDLAESNINTAVGKPSVVVQAENILSEKDNSDNEKSEKRSPQEKLQFDFLNASESLIAIKEAIEQSEEGDKVLIKSFLWRDDEVGRKMAELILAKAKAGVKFVIFKDAIGAFFEYSEGSQQSLFHDPKDFKSFHRQSQIMRKFYGVPEELPEARENNLADRLRGNDNIEIHEGERYDHSKLVLVYKKEVENSVAILGGVGFGKEFEKNEKQDGSIKMEGKEYVETLIQKLGGEEPGEIKGVSFHTNRMEEEKPISIVLSEMIKDVTEIVNLAISYLGNPQYIRDLAELLKKNSKIIISTYLSEDSNINGDRNWHFLWELIRKLFLSLGVSYDNIPKKVPDNLNMKVLGEMMHIKALILDKVLLLGSGNLTMIKGINELNIAINSDDNTEGKVLIEKVLSFLNGIPGDELDSLQMDFPCNGLVNYVSSKVDSIITLIRGKNQEDTKDSLNQRTEINSSDKGKKINFIRSRVEWAAAFMQKTRIWMKKNEIKNSQNEEMETIKKFFDQCFP